MADDKAGDADDEFNPDDFPLPEGWNPVLSEEELNMLRAEPTPVKQMSTADKVAKVFNDNALDAAEIIIEIAMSDPSSARRLSAAKYIVDRVIGPVSQQQTGAAADTTYELLQGLLREPTAAERSKGRKIQ